MKKLKKYLDKWLNGQKTNGIYVTPEDIFECLWVYNTIASGEKPKFINSKVKEVLDKCNIKTVIDGIGWKVI